MKGRKLSFPAADGHHGIGIQRTFHAAVQHGAARFAGGGKVGPDIVAELFPGTDPAKLSFAEMVDFLKLKRFGSLVDSEMNQQVFILDLSFNPEITDELMVIYFDLNKEIFCITHES